MRNLIKDPVTYDEVCTTVQHALTEREIVEEKHGESLSFLHSFLANPYIKKQLIAHLEEVQPKAPLSDLTKLDVPTINVLYQAAYGYMHGTVYSVKYMGISKRGSHVYDLNECSARTDPRLYVRIVEGILRGELNEDNFSGPKRVEVPRPAVDEPTSDIGIWLKKWWNS